MDRATLLTCHATLCSEARDLMKKKNADYAADDDALQNFHTAAVLGIADGDAGILVRITDKLQRLANLRTRNNEVIEESEEDTVLDLINYAVLYLAYRYDQSAEVNDE